MVNRKVSIIIPAYNAVATLENTIWTARHQQYDNTEIIVVDDHSTDDTDLLALEHTKPFGPILVFRHDERKGPAEARNTAIRNATGDLILPLDADDLIQPDFITKTICQMGAGIGFVSTQMQYFGIEDRTIPIKIRTYEEELQSNEIPVTSLIDREAILNSGGYRADVPGFEDWGLWLDILSRNWRMAIIDEPLFMYRRRENHFGTTAWNNKFELAKNMRKRHPRFLEGVV